MERRDKKHYRRSTFQRLFVSQSSGLLRNRPFRAKNAGARSLRGRTKFTGIGERNQREKIKESNKTKKKRKQ